jgi:hypothetical protein
MRARSGAGRQCVATFAKSSAPVKEATCSAAHASARRSYTGLMTAARSDSSQAAAARSGARRNLGRCIELRRRQLIGIDPKQDYKDKVAEVSSHGWGCADLRDTQKRWTYADFSYTTIEKGGRSWRRPATGQADEGKGYGVLRFASPSRTAGQPRLADDQAIAAGRAGESARSDPNIVRSRRVIARLCVCLVELPQPQRADFFTAALERMHRATVAWLWSTI